MFARVFVRLRSACRCFALTPLGTVTELSRFCDAKYFSIVELPSGKLVLLGSENSKEEEMQSFWHSGSGIRMLKAPSVGRIFQHACATQSFSFGPHLEMLGDGFVLLDPRRLKEGGFRFSWRKTLNDRFGLDTPRVSGAISKSDELLEKNCVSCTYRLFTYT